MPDISGRRMLIDRTGSHVRHNCITGDDGRNSGRGLCHQVAAKVATPAEHGAMAEIGSFGSPAATEITAVGRVSCRN